MKKVNWTEEVEEIMETDNPEKEMEDKILCYFCEREEVIRKYDYCKKCGREIDEWEQKYGWVIMTIYGKEYIYTREQWKEIGKRILERKNGIQMKRKEIGNNPKRGNV